MKSYRNIWIILVSAIGLAVLMSSCNQGADERIKGDVVFIPNTADGEADMDRLPTFEFKEIIHDFGKVIRGEVVTYAFSFVNTGNTDLLIADISSSCGCTATEYPELPVKPGEKNYIKVTFDSNGRKGFQNKTITIAANTQPRTTTLSIKAMVVMPELN